MVFVEHGEHGSSAAAPLVAKLTAAYLKREKGPSKETLTASAAPAAGPH